MRTDRVDISQTLSGIEKGADGYLLIPLDEGELQAVLKNLIGIKQKLRANSASVTLPELRYNTFPGHDNRFIQKILSLLDANIDNDQFGIVELCYALGMSRAQIYRKFKSITDSTPHDFLRSYRLKRAKELLLTTKLNVSEAAYRTGFKNISHFSRIFTEEFGKNPSKFSR
jgi:transcriptional regulator GlxA family with amidase domain